MKHARSDYNRIQDPAGLIPKDEPVFLFRAQDALAMAALEAYANAAQNCGLDEIERLTRAHIEAFRQWTKQKLPDLAPPDSG